MLCVSDQHSCFIYGRFWVQFSAQRLKVPSVPPGKCISYLKIGKTSWFKLNIHNNHPIQYYIIYADEDTQLNKA
jgi:hypothetical protein